MLRNAKHNYLRKNHYFNLRKRTNNISRDLGVLMKQKTPFTILNKKFNKMDLIKHSIKSKDFWDKEFKDHPTSNQCLIYCD